MIMEDITYKMNVKRIVWMAFGLFTLITLLLCTYSELRIIMYSRDFEPLAANYIPVSCVPNEVFNNKVVHVNCLLEHLNTFYPPTEFSRNFKNLFVGAFFEMKIEMYQWDQIFGMNFESKFTDKLIDSSPFSYLFANSHENPNFMPYVSEYGRKFAKFLKIGGFSITKDILTEFHHKKQIELKDDGIFIPSETRPPLFLNSISTQVKDNAIYSGDPSNPQIGDIRITFWGSAATHVSLIGVQNFDPENQNYYISGYKQFNTNNSTITMFSEGDLTPDELINRTFEKRVGSKFLINFLRISTVILLWLFYYWSFEFCENKKSVLITLLLCFLSSLLTLSIISAFLWFIYSIYISFILLAVSLILIVIVISIWVTNCGINENEEPSSSLLHATVSLRPVNSCSQADKNSHSYKSVVRWSTSPIFNQE